MDQADIPALLSRLSSDEDAMRKMAVFKLQSSINDPAFADTFIASGGLNILRRLIMSTGGNTLAYSLQSLTRLLEVDMGWDIFESAGAGELVERLVELIVTHPLVNILRGAMSILVAIVSYPQTPRGKDGTPGAFGFRALKPAIAVYPQFFEMVVSQLNSADHALCANALLLLNALMRDSITNEVPPGKELHKYSQTGEEWPKFIKRLQDLGVVKAVYALMQGSALQDLAHPLLEFQSLSKVLLRKWREIRVDLEKPDHRRALKALHLASAPERKDKERSNTIVSRAETVASELASGSKGSSKHRPDKWRRLGFETENPAWEFDQTGFLGMMDVTDYVKKHEDGFQKLLQEQASRPLEQRCPIVRSSLAVTLILYEHFDVDKSDLQNAKANLVLDGMKNYDKVFRPLVLQWSRLHSAAVRAFFKLWGATGATQADFFKVAELVRILVEQVVGGATRQKDILDVEDELLEFDVGRLRELQMELLELSFDDEWGDHLYNIRKELRNDALQFVKEQRVRCLLKGAWFPRGDGWRFVRLSYNRRYLHYADFETQTLAGKEPGLDELGEKIDLSLISSVISNVSASHPSTSSISSASTLKTTSQAPAPTTTKITINSFVAAEAGKDKVERPILTLLPTSHSAASEWLDGLLMLLNQTPITAETKKLVDLVAGYGVRIRLLNVRLDEGQGVGSGVVPSREGLGEDYWFEV